MLDAVTVLRRGAATEDALGGHSYGADTQVATTTGRISALKGRDLERIIAGGVAQEGLQRLSVPRGADVRGTDRVRVVSARNGTTKTFEVVEIAPLGSLAVHRKLIVREIGA